MKHIIDRILSVCPHGEPLHEPEFQLVDRAAVSDAVKQGFVSTKGPYVGQFEALLANRTGRKYCVATSSGTAALHLVLAALGSDWERVAVPSLTFVATANAVAHAKGVPNFEDCADDMGMAKSAPHCSVAIPVHVLGNPMDIGRIDARFVIEDATEALGSTLNGKPCGSFGLASVFSFNGNKIVTTGQGGAVLTDDPDLASRVRHLGSTAKLTHRWEYEHDRVGFNYRMPNLNAALGVAQLSHLDERLERKRRLHATYVNAFAVCEGAHIFEPNPGSNYWLIALVLDDPLMKDSLLEALHSRGINARPLWTPLHLLPMYRSNPRTDMTRTMDFYSRVICLPSSARLA